MILIPGPNQQPPALNQRPRPKLRSDGAQALTSIGRSTQGAEGISGREFEGRLMGRFSRMLDRARVERPASFFSITLDMGQTDEDQFRFQVQSPSGLWAALSKTVRKIRAALRQLEWEFDELCQATTEGRLSEEMKALGGRVQAPTVSLLEWLLPAARQLILRIGSTIRDLIAALFSPSVLSAGGRAGSFVTRC